jgi:hypothetical protein
MPANVGGLRHGFDFGAAEVDGSLNLIGGDKKCPPARPDLTPQGAVSHEMFSVANEPLTLRLASPRTLVY